MIRIGEMNQFIVLRKSDLGYMLTNKEDQILLHFNQTNNRELELNSMIECFVQYDSKGRISATLEEPSVTISKPGWAQIVEVNPRLGIFISINTFKDILISKDDLPQDVHFWPHVGEKVLVSLFLKKDRLNGRLLNKQEIIKLNGRVPKLELGSKINARLVRVSNNALNAVTEELHYIYISSKQFRGIHHIGEEVNLMVIGFHEDEIVASLNKEKQEMVPLDEEMILAYIKKNGSMPYTAKTDSKTIEEVFHMSRKAFKRALGDLYKKHLVYFDDDTTYLVK